MDYFYQRNRCSPPIYCTLSLSFWLFSSRPIRRVRYTFSKSPYAGCQRNHSRSFYNIANIVDGSHCFMEMASLFSQAFYIPIYILFLSLAVSGQHSVLRHTGGTGISGFFTNFFSEALQKFIFQRHSVCQYICCKPLPRRTKFRASPFCFYYGVHIWSFKNKETRKFYHFFALPCTHFT